MRIARTRMTLALTALVLATAPLLALAQVAAVPTPVPTVKAVPKKLDKPLWRELTPAQQVALQPLRPEWDAMDSVRKRKWLELASRYASMKPPEQQRVHERMRDWMKLTPAQRMVARENYTRTKKIDPGKKSATWQSYQQLPDDEKKKLAASRKPAAAAQSGAARLHATAPVAPAPCPAGSVRSIAATGPACVPAPIRPAPTSTTPATPAVTVPNAN